MELATLSIEIVAIGNDQVYSVGRIHVTRTRDIYLVSKLKDAGLHFSRHRDGTCHVRMKGESLSHFEKRVSIGDFDGFEFLQTWAFGIDSLPQAYQTYRPKKRHAVIAINMTLFENSAFNLGIALLTEKGLPYLMNLWKDFDNRQVYICAYTHPMIGIVFGAFRNVTEILK